MSPIAATAESAGSNLVSGQGTNALTFVLPNSPQYVVQSVVATVDNSAGGDATGTLTFADTNGVVIARKRQGQTVDAGASTTATWALRLTDEQPLSGFIRYVVDNVGAWLSIATEPDGAGGTLGRSFGIFLPGGPNHIGDFELQSTDNGNVNTGSFLFSVTNGATFSIPIGQFTVDCSSAQITTENGGDIRLLPDSAGGGFVVAAADTVQIDGQHGGVAISAENGSNITLVTGTSGGEVELEGPIVIKLDSAAQKVVVQDTVGNPIFIVNEDGSLQGKTGKSLTFNL